MRGLEWRRVRRVRSLSEGFFRLGRSSRVGAAAMMLAVLAYVAALRRRHRRE